MKLFERFQSLLAFSRLRTINIVSEAQADGHIFISSPELKGFSLMLAPEQGKNGGALFAAIHDPLLTYMEAFCRAQDHAKAEKSHLEVKNWGKIAPNSYEVQLSPC